MDLLGTDKILEEDKNIQTPTHPHFLLRTTTNHIQEENHWVHADTVL